MGSDFKPRLAPKIAEAGDTTHLAAENDAIGKKRKKRRYALEQLIGRITAANRHGEISWGPSVGKEFW
jgi:antitoxin component of MazEF toxin-antitoxin module